MSQLPRILYMKCLKSDLREKTISLGDTGLFKKYILKNPQDVRLQQSLTEGEVIVQISIEGFRGENPTFIPIAEGIWENNSPILKEYVSEYKSGEVSSTFSTIRD